MKKAIFTMILCAAACFLHAQEATNIYAVQQDNTIVIFYDLDKDADIMISASLDGGKNFIDLTEVTGDVGKNIKAGKGKTINWKAVEEIGFANVNKMQFQVKAASNVIVANKEELVYNKGNLCLLRKEQKTSKTGIAYTGVEYIKLTEAEIQSMMMENGKDDVYYDYYLKGKNRKRIGNIVGGSAFGGLLLVNMIFIIKESDASGLVLLPAPAIFWAVFYPSGNKKIKKAAQLYNDGPSKKSYGMYLSPAKNGIGVCLNF